MNAGVSCTFIPSKGKEVLKQLKDEFGYNIAREVFMKAAVNTKFKETYKKTLRLTPEGVVSFDSLLGNREIQKFVGEEKILMTLNRPYDTLEDTKENYIMALESANTFNTTNSARNNYVATVNYVDKNKIKVVVQRKTERAVAKFRNQYSTQKLNQRLAQIFEPLGITIGKLTEAELNAGRVGVTDFSNAQDIANGFVNLIRIANNAEGEVALSEEFSHLIVGIFRDEPIVQRCISLLSENTEKLRKILGNKDFDSTVEFYTDEEGNTDWDMVAEEALGHILKEKLVTNNTDNLPRPSLFQRMFSWFKRLFSGFSESDIKNAIIDVDTSMDELAKSILRGDRQITQADIYNSHREARLNALSDRIDRNIDILKRQREVEMKRDKISKGRVQGIDITINTMGKYVNPQADTVEGILTYAHEAVAKLKGINSDLDRIENDSTMPFQEVFSRLRIANGYVKSYQVFIDDMYRAIQEESKESDNMFLRTFNINGREIDVKTVIDELNALSRSISTRYIDVARPKFIAFLKPYYGESFRIPSGKDAGKLITVDDLIMEARNGDISFMDKWLDSMADSSDAALQLFNKVVMREKDAARLETMDYFRKIWELRQEAESLGITSFEWMFEKDSTGKKSGNYVSKVNYAEYERKRKEHEEYLDRTYGENPTGPEAIAKVDARRKWRAENSLTLVGPEEPKPDLYPPAELTDAQRRILDKFIALKTTFDSKYPPSRVAANKAIQIRKSAGQRILDSGSLSGAWDNAKEAVLSAIVTREDDDAVFGDNVARGLRDFDGTEYLTLPVVYTNKLRNPDELSTDVFGSLMAYAWATCHYDHMDNIVDTLEVGKELMSSKVRKVTRRSLDKKLVERFNRNGETVTSEISEGVTNIEEKLQSFLESQVYGRYLKEGKEFEILGAKINTNKATSLILRASSMAQLGFNWLANIANVTTGLAMQNIEAVAGQFFGGKELLKADKIYVSALPEFVCQLGARVNQSDLALFCELFNVKQNFGEKARRAVQRKNLLMRIFGASIAFLGQTCGDHWLYSRTALAMWEREEVYVDGKKYDSSWEAFRACIVEKNGFRSVDRNKLRDKNGNPIDISAVSRAMEDVNHVCFGIYNDDGANAASRVALGRLVQHYRKWMKRQYSRRFQKGQQNLSTNTWEEGYYHTIGRLFNEIRRGERQLAHMNLSEDERYNVRRAMFEMVQAFAVWLVAEVVNWPDDKERPYILKLLEYVAKRLKHELHGLIPWLTMPKEMLKTVKSPIPSLTWVGDVFTLIGSAFTPSDYIEEVESGPYKGYTKVERAAVKAIPILMWPRQIQKFMGDLDSSIQYYMRPAVY